MAKYTTTDPITFPLHDTHRGTLPTDNLTLADQRAALARLVTGGDAAENPHRGSLGPEYTCEEDSATCGRVRREFIQALSEVIALDPEYFKGFLSYHKGLGVRLAPQYKYVELLSAIVSKAMQWPEAITVHTMACLYFGFTEKEVLEFFQIEQKVREWTLHAMGRPNWKMPKIEYRNWADWMAYYSACLGHGFEKGIVQMEQEENLVEGITEDRILTIREAVNACYQWRSFYDARAIPERQQVLKPVLDERKRLVGESSSSSVN